MQRLSRAKKAKIQRLEVRAVGRLIGQPYIPPLLLSLSCHIIIVWSSMWLRKILLGTHRAALPRSEELALSSWGRFLNQPVFVDLFADERDCDGHGVPVLRFWLPRLALSLRVNGQTPIFPPKHFSFFMRIPARLRSGSWKHSFSYKSFAPA